MHLTKQDIAKALGTGLFALLLSYGIGISYAAWTAPTSYPPNGNVMAPLNTGYNQQFKDGSLFLNSSTTAQFDWGLIVAGGKTWLHGTTTIGIQDASNGLLFDVNGKVGAAQYCDENGTNCLTASALGGGGSGTFGGTGTDGPITVTSPSSPIDLDGVEYFEKNYESISITGTGRLTFTNPSPNGTYIVLRSKGGVTITCTSAPCIDVSGMGAAGGVGGPKDTTGADRKGNLGTSGLSSFGIADDNSHSGIVGSEGVIAPYPVLPVPPLGGSGGSVYLNKYIYTLNQTALSRRNIVLVAGSGGGGGSSGSKAPETVGVWGGAGGAGGRGGGALLIESGGALNFTGTIWAKGLNGEDGSNPLGDTEGYLSAGGGGGGGAGGMVLVLYNTLISSSGSISTAGGTGGKGGNYLSTAYRSAIVYGGAGGGGAGAYGGAGGLGGTGGPVSVVGLYPEGGSGGGVSAGGGGGGGAGNYIQPSPIYGGLGGLGGPSAPAVILKNYSF
jgi:hypothetical protein